VTKGDATNSLTSPLKAVGGARAARLHLHRGSTGDPVGRQPHHRREDEVPRHDGNHHPLGVCGPDTFDERGFLGVAFHPNFQLNGLFYTYTSEVESGPQPGELHHGPAGSADHQNVISEWRAVDPANPAAGVAAGRRELIRANWPQFNHDGGDLAFGPDGKLYITMGDGGGAMTPMVSSTSSPAEVSPDPDVQPRGTDHGPPGQRQRAEAQHAPRQDPPHPTSTRRSRRASSIACPPTTHSWAGPCRRSGPTVTATPYRFGFDDRHGDLYVGDVGQNDIEEVDQIVPGGNYGGTARKARCSPHQRH